MGLLGFTSKYKTGPPHINMPTWRTKYEGEEGNKCLESFKDKGNENEAIMVHKTKQNLKGPLVLRVGGYFGFDT